MPRPCPAPHPGLRFTINRPVGGLQTMVCLFAAAGEAPTGPWHSHQSRPWSPQGRICANKGAGAAGQLRAGCGLAVGGLCGGLCGGHRLPRTRASPSRSTVHPGQAVGAPSVGPASPTSPRPPPQGLPGASGRWVGGRALGQQAFHWVPARAGHLTAPPSPSQGSLYPEDPWGGSAPIPVRHLRLGPAPQVGI